MKFIHQPSKSDSLGSCLLHNLAQPWTHFRAAVAFVKHSGTRHIAASLANFSKTGSIEIIAGIDHEGTSYEGLRDLLNTVSPKGRVVILHNRMHYTFHPKIYLFKSPSSAELIIASGNLTEGGLFTNYETALRVSLNLDNPEEVGVLKSVEGVLNTWADPSSKIARILDDDLLNRLARLGLISIEAHEHRYTKAAAYAQENSDIPFASRPEIQAPSAPHDDKMDTISMTSVDSDLARSYVHGFVMTLQNTDAGIGQKKPGTSQRSPEIFIPLAARDMMPAFWGWTEKFVPDSNKPGKYDRRNVPMGFEGEKITVNMMTWPDRHDFRIRCAALRNASNIGDILRLEIAANSDDFAYFAQIIPITSNQHDTYARICRYGVQNSAKKFGYYRKNLTVF